MKKTTIGLTVAALVLGGSAYAAPGNPAAPTTASTSGERAFTRAQAQASATEMFTRLDVNKDGKLDRADRDARREATKTHMFDRLDTNKDGQISRAEFMADRGPGARAAARAEAGAPSADGGKREGRRGFGRHHGGGRMMAGKGPGAQPMRTPATQADFVAAALQRFDATDLNKDGQVTSAERRQAREQRQAQRQQARAAKAQN